MAYYHQCPPEVIEHAEFDATGKQTKPEKRTPRTDGRDERIAPGIIYFEGQPSKSVLVPGETNVFRVEPATLSVVSEGKGRTRK